MHIRGISAECAVNRGSQPLDVLRVWMLLISVVSYSLLPTLLPSILVVAQNHQIAVQNELAMGRGQNVPLVDEGSAAEMVLGNGPERNLPRELPWVGFVTVDDEIVYFAVGGVVVEVVLGIVGRHGEAERAGAV